MTSLCSLTDLLESHGGTTGHRSRKVDGKMRACMNEQDALLLCGMIGDKVKIWGLAFGCGGDILRTRQVISMGSHPGGHVRGRHCYIDGRVSLGSNLDRC